MIKRFILAGLCCLPMAGVSAEEVQTPAPGVLRKMVIPFIPKEYGADQAWAHVATLIELTPQRSVTGPFPGYEVNNRGYVFWQEFSNRLLRETGLQFCREYPDDARCWIWLEATRARDPRYWNIAEGWLAQSGERSRAEPRLDEQASAEWKVAYAGLRDAAIASDNAPDALRASLWAERAREPLMLQTSAFLRKEKFDPSVVDIHAAGADIDALGREFADGEHADKIYIRSIAKQFFGFVRRFSPGAEEQWRTAFRNHPNAQLSELVQSMDNLRRAQKEPMEVRFTAIDGREVDLAKLRGKAVLLEFRGVTWCAACRKEEPFVKAVYDKYHDQGLEIITITHESTPENRQAVLDYLKEKGLVWPHSFDGDAENNVYLRRFGITGVPELFLLDREGLLVSNNVRGNKLEPAVRKVLGLPATAGE